MPSDEIVAVAVSPTFKSPELGEKVRLEIGGLVASMEAVLTSTVVEAGLLYCPKSSISIKLTGTFPELLSVSPS